MRAAAKVVMLRILFIFAFRVSLTFRHKLSAWGRPFFAKSHITLHDWEHRLMLRSPRCLRFGKVARATPLYKRLYQPADRSRPKMPRDTRIAARLMTAFISSVALTVNAPAFAQMQHDASTHMAQTDNAATSQTSADTRGTQSASSYHSATTFTLKTGIATGRMVYIGVGGDIDGQVNPKLMVHEGELVQINLINGEGAEHDIVLDQYAARSSIIVGQNASSTFSFVATKVGEFSYYCSIAGHREAGMEGLIQVMAGPRAAMESAAPDIVRDPADLPEPIGSRPPRVVKVELETVEMTGHLDDGTTYVYWTFNRKVPGPFVRVRVGDTVEVDLKNPEDSVMPHSVDFHAATGPGGGADFTQTAPGESSTVTFKAMKPGIYVYHCATPSVAHHITSGMYGLILVEPE